MVTPKKIRRRLVKKHGGENVGDVSCEAPPTSALNIPVSALRACYCVYLFLILSRSVLFICAPISTLFIMLFLSLSFI